MNDPRGSLWRRWDLHVHTPCSIHQNYGGNTTQHWERFIEELEALPPEFAVVGINDYLFLDGYKRVLEYRNGGRLKNIATILPVLEFRIDKFGGTDGKLRRINLHVIFSNELSCDQIEQQFLAKLTAGYKLSPEHSNLTWGGTITPASLRDLGQCIIDSVPAERRHEYGAPLIEGFNNLNLGIDQIESALDSPYFLNRHLVAIGKTEWSSLKWNDQSIAEKKHLINCARLVFVAAGSTDEYAKSRAALADNGVNSKLLDCSDAHNWTDSKDKDRIGRCDTWIRADATFQGLQHALLEFDDRVYVGTIPGKLVELRNGAHRHIDKISIRKLKTSNLTEHWFSGEVPLNPGLVAIIGNKGSGKSALADIIALGGNSAQQASFSFLNEQKFCRPRDNKAEHYEASLRWCSGEDVTYSLSKSYDSSDIERVKYIPQSHLESLCNELSSDGGGAFEAELRQVIFSHIPDAERLNKPNLDALLTFLSEGAQARLAELRGELSRLNRQIADTEEHLSPEHKKEVEKKLTAKLRELDTHNAGKPQEVPKPDADPEARQAIENARALIEAKRAEIAQLESAVDTARVQRKDLVPLIATVDKVLERISNLEARFRDAARESEADLQALGMKFESIAKLEVDTKALRDRKAELASRDAKTKTDLDASAQGSPQHKLVAAREALIDLQNKLDTPTRRYEEYLTNLKQWSDAGQLLQAGKENSESIEALRAELQRIAELPRVLGELESQRMRASRGIFDKLADLKEQFRNLYRPVQEFIAGHKSLASSISLSFDVRISEQGFLDGIMTWLHQGRTGSFQGSEEGTSRLKMLLSKHSFDSFEATEAFLTDFMQDMRSDNRSNPPRPVSTKAQLKSNKSVAEFYDFVFGLGYAKPRYALKMDGKEIVELSPGERGLLLLLFYLLVEKSDVPLVIDQPEENLDNETIHDVLVPSIRLAKQRRQVVIVTHNPNMAVVSDADQVIAARIDKKDGYRVNYDSGALENPHVNQFVVRYLEGTMPAFMNRDGKYMRGK